jgi:hypothetical protein
MKLKFALAAILLIVSVSGISSFAASVNVALATYQSDGGQLVYVYFETTSGPSSSTPSTNTAQTPSSSSGSYQVAKGSSAYLWSPQFAGSGVVSQGTWVLDLWASCTTANTISISIYTTTSSGTIQSTILGGGSTNTISTSKTQIVSTFSGTQGTIPSNGYISVVLAVPNPGPRHCTIYWGNSQQTNFQVPFRILST